MTVTSQDPRDRSQPTDMESLLHRLNEAESILAAIGSGQIDAVVVSGSPDSRVFVLESADQPYRLLVEQLQEGVALLTLRGDVMFANRKLAELLNRPQQALVGLSFEAFVTDEDVTIFRQLLARVQSAPGTAELVLRPSDRPGLNVHLSLSHLDVGGTQALSVIVSDLTEQKRSAEMIAAQRLTQSVLDQALEAIIACDNDGRVVRANPAALALGAAPVVGLRWEQAFAFSPSQPGSDGPTAGDVVARALVGVKTTGFPTSLTNSDGMALDVLINAGPLRDEQARIIGCLLTLMDVTDRNRSAARLHESEERLRLATQVSGYGFHDCDLTRRRIYGTLELRQLLGIDPTQPLTLELAQALVYGDDLERVANAVRETLDPRGSGECVLEFRIRRPRDGQIRWLFNRSQILFSDEGPSRRPIRMTGVIVDITERKQADIALLRAAQRSEALQGVATHLSGAVTSQEIIAGVLVQGLAVLQGSAAAFLQLEPNDVLVVAQQVGFEPEAVLGRFPLSALFPMAEAVRERRLVTTSSLEDLAARYPAAAPRRRTTGHQASAYVPLIVHHKTLGGLAFSFDRVRDFDADEQAFLLTLAELCAQALDRARLFEAESEVRRDAEAAAARLSQLQTVTAALNTTLTREAVATLIVDQALPILGADAASLAILSDDGAEFEMLASHGVSMELVGQWRRFAAEPGLPMSDAVLSGRLVLLPDRDSIVERYPTLSPAPGDTRAWAVLPLIHAGRALGALSLAYERTRSFSSGDEALLMALGQQFGQALERARLFEEGQALNATLEQRVAERTTELEQSRSQLRVLNRHLDTIREDERTRLSREIHDQLGGTLTGLKMDVSYLRRHWSDPDANLTGRLADLSRNLDSTVQLVRDIAADLRPGMLDEFGLPAAIEWQLEDFRARTGMIISLRNDLSDFVWNRECATALYRVFQEALTNVTRHAQATRVDVHLEQQGADLVMRIADNGRGLEAADLAGKRSLGVLGMHERIAAYSGELRFDATQDGGTTVWIRLPLDQCRRADPPPA